jgi:beta-glucanase (GH16 family)
VKLNALALATTTAAIFLLACQKKEEYGPLPVFQGVQLEYSFDSKPVWQDEFDKDGLPDASKWDYDVGGGGWGNNELQFYNRAVLKNSRVEGGKLIIEAHKEQSGGRDYSSARLISKRKGDWLYGKIEVRAKLPQGTGTWPAIWMLATEQSYGTQYWPDNGEIDLMEHVGFDPNRVHGNIHTKAYHHSIGTNKGNNMMVPTAFTEFHDYTLEWTPSTITLLIDKKSYFVFNNEGSWQTWPFDKPFHLLLNIAVGGNWGGQKGIDDRVFPQRMEVEYVRVYPLITIKK